MELQGPLRPRILIVEDEFLIRLTLAEALSDEGFEVFEAESGDAALPIAEEDPSILLLLTDIQLPGTLDGVRLAEAVRQRLPQLPVIFMTGRPMTRTAGRISPLDVYITKPYTLAEICETAKRLIRAAPS